jgi:hypothetical protein
MSATSEPRKGRPGAKGRAGARRTAPPSPRVERAELLALLRLLTRQPPPGHDFKTCAICRHHGITEI